MAPSRSATACSRAAPSAAPKKVPVATMARARAVSTADSRKIAAILREIQIDGEALSAQIKRLRHRFL